MKIAQIAPLIESVPPTKYGGTERVVSALTEALVRRGHDVTLFATGNSHTSARLISSYPTGLREAFPTDISARNLYTHLHLGTAYGMQNHFDIIHDHTESYGGAFAQLSPTPVVMTFHSVITPHLKHMFQTFTKPSIISISHRQQVLVPELKYTATVHNGLNFQEYPLGEQQGKYLLFVGRICEQKGPHHAIEVARQTHLPLIIAAKYEPNIEANKNYFTKFIEPLLSTNIRFIGEVTEQERNKLFTGAIASLHPATWEEPFGLTLIEAMACGCPVVAFRHGAIPEIVKEGTSGYIVDSLPQMIDAVKRITEISRIACAQYARQSFSAMHMAENYERVYYTMLRQHSASSPTISASLSPLRFGNKFFQLHHQNN